MEPVERVSALSVKSHTVFCTVVHQYRQPPGAAMPRQHPGLHLADMSHLAQSRHTSTSISETLTTLPACSLTFQALQIFSTDCDSPHSLEGTIRRCSTQELHTSVSAFLDLRPDGYAVHKKSKRLAILEFTRAMDSSDDLELQKDTEKRKRYDPVLEFFSRYQTDRVGL